MNFPIPFLWNGEVFTPLKRFAKECDKRFVVGDCHLMEEIHERSMASHNHEFAFIAETWRNLPERYQTAPWAQSAEHLRKFALIRCHFCDTATYVCGTKAEAQRWAVNLRPIDEYSIVTVEGTTVYRFTAQSQSKRAMGAKRFQESKTALMEFCASLIDVAPAQLERAGAERFQERQSINAAARDERRMG